MKDTGREMQETRALVQASRFPDVIDPKVQQKKEKEQSRFK